MVPTGDVWALALDTLAKARELTEPCVVCGATATKERTDGQPVCEDHADAEDTSD